MTALLLAASNPPVEANLNLNAVSPQQASIELCFKGNGQAVRFEMVVQASGKAGNNRSRQAGEVKASENGACPVRNKLGFAAHTVVSAHLKWWVDGIEQPEVHKQLGGSSEDSEGTQA
jgi:hypothetical protein